MRLSISCIAIIVMGLTAMAGAEAVDYSQYRHWAGVIEWSGPASAIERFSLEDQTYCLAMGPQEGCVIYDLSDPSQPTAVGSAHLLGPETDAVVEGWYAYVATGSFGLSSLIIADPSDPWVAVNLELPGFAHRLAKVGDHLFLACGDAGLVVVQVVGNIQLFHLATHDQWGGVRSVMAKDGLIYAGLEDGGLVTIDVTDPYNPEEMGRLVDPLRLLDLDCVGDRLIATVEGNDTSAVILDISDPTQPRFLTTAAPDGFGSGRVSVVGEEVLLAGRRGVVAMPATNLDRPQVIFTQRMQPDCLDIAGGDGWLMAASVRGLELFQGAPPGPPEPYSILSSLGSQRLFLKDDLLISCHNNGLTLFDVSDPTQMQVTADYIIPNSLGWELVDDIVWISVSGSQRGLHAVDIADPTAPFTRSYREQTVTSGLTIAGHYAYVPLYSEDWEQRIYDISDPDAPEFVGTFSTQVRMRELIYHRGYLFGRNQHVTQLSVFDASEPSHPVYITDFFFNSGSARLSMAGDCMAVAHSNSDGRVDFFDMSNPLEPQQIGVVSGLTGNGYASKLVGDWLYVMPPGTIIDVSDPSQPAVIGGFGNQLDVNWMVEMAVDGEALFFDYTSGPLVAAPSPLTTVAAVADPVIPPSPSLLAVTAAPNPFNPQVTIAYDLPWAGEVIVDIVDIRGRLIRHLVSEQRSAGLQTTAWDGNDARGQALPTGVYLARVVTPRAEATTKLSLVR